MSIVDSGLPPVGRWVARQHRQHVLRRANRVAAQRHAASPSDCAATDGSHHDHHHDYHHHQRGWGRGNFWLQPHAGPRLKTEDDCRGPAAYERLRHRAAAYSARSVLNASDQTGGLVKHKNCTRNRNRCAIASSMGPGALGSVAGGGAPVRLARRPGREHHAAHVLRVQLPIVGTTPATER